ncbi:hypothetical protein Gogos_017100 [Gossypium gossypioides]|uniref:Uncharacterized protein n=1 Tax=Gossypium gossypioides TaxID=34282 RepID=A0A7J9B9N5_GOSGO|nr:hypothetical protein [Gossypium gossypioides]
MKSRLLMPGKQEILHFLKFQASMMNLVLRLPSF